MADDQSNLRLIRIYLKDASFESPTAPESFKIKAEPTIDLAVRVNVRALNAENFEVVITGSITARAEGHTLFLAEAQQAGLVMAKGLAPEVLDRKLHVYFPKQLFPFLREALASLTMKGGFPPVQIALVDFDEQYANRAKQPMAQA
jgi:preprotein translocase subunit SecB